MDGCESSRTCFSEPPNRLILVAVLGLAGIFVVQLLVKPFRDFAMAFLAMNSQEFLGKGRIWQPVTAIFLHLAFSRLAINALLLWALGNPLANAWKKREFVAYSLFCGVAGFLVFFLWNMVRPTATVAAGASGVAFGLLGAYGMVYSERQILLLFCIPMRVKWFVSLCFLLFLGLLFSRFGNQPDLVVSLGGGVCGVVLLKVLWFWQDRQPRGSGSRDQVANRMKGLEVMGKDDA
jgi:membrane associated rhomboid family serine protease